MAQNISHDFTHDNHFRSFQMSSVSEEDLQLALLDAQLQLRSKFQGQAGNSVLILINGIELAGKGDAVTQLRDWMDARFLKVKATVPEQLDHNQPFWTRYTHDLPMSGQVAIFFSNWYGDLFYSALHDKTLSETKVRAYLEQMQAFERLLSQNGITLVKCWFNLSWEILQDRLNHLDLDAMDITTKQFSINWRHKHKYNEVLAWAKTLTKDWYEIECGDSKKRDMHFGQMVLEAIQYTIEREEPSKPTREWKNATIPPVLLQPEKNSKIDKEEYKTLLSDKQKNVCQLLRKHRQKSSVIIVFEGMDAAGKGGAIRRLVKKLDPREYQIHSIGKPNSYELQRPYLWRFMADMPEKDAFNQYGICIFDRSWYGRVLVERVEELTPPEAWQRAYREINEFEKQLADNNIVLIKFWLSISKEEQESRFESRANTIYKQYKLDDEDWRNRARWDNYLQCAADAFEHTSSSHAPWKIIATDDKRMARLQVLAHIEEVLSNKAILAGKKKQS